MNGWLAVLSLVPAIACGDGGSAYRDGMSLVCGPGAQQVGSTERGAAAAAMLEDGVADPDVRALLRTLPEVPVERRGAVIGAAAERAGLATCGGRSVEKLAASTGYFGVSLPGVGVGSFASAADTVPLVAVTVTDVIVGGTAVASIANGDVDPSQKEGGVLGRKIPAVTTAAASAPAAVSVALDREVPFGVIDEVVFSLVQHETPVHAVSILATRGGLVVAYRVTQPRRGVNGGLIDPEVPTPEQPPLVLVVELATDRLRVWSRSGIIGTAATPYLELPATDLHRLTVELGELVRRRFPDGKRSEADRHIVLSLDAKDTAQQLVELIGAVATDGSGAPLFPGIWILERTP